MSILRKTLTKLLPPQLKKHITCTEDKNFRHVHHLSIKNSDLPHITILSTTIPSVLKYHDPLYIRLPVDSLNYCNELLEKNETAVILVFYKDDYDPIICSFPITEPTFINPTWQTFTISLSTIEKAQQEGFAAEKNAIAFTPQLLLDYMHNPNKYLNQY